MTLSYFEKDLFKHKHTYENTIVNACSHMTPVRTKQLWYLIKSIILDKIMLCTVIAFTLWQKTFICPYSLNQVPLVLLEEAHVAWTIGDHDDILLKESLDTYKRLNGKFSIAGQTVCQNNYRHRKTCYIFSLITSPQFSL